MPLPLSVSSMPYWGLPPQSGTAAKGRPPSGIISVLQARYTHLRKTHLLLKDLEQQALQRLRLQADLVITLIPHLLFQFTRRLDGCGLPQLEFVRLQGSRRQPVSTVAAGGPCFPAVCPGWLLCVHTDSWAPGLVQMQWVATCLLQAG